MSGKIKLLDKQLINKIAAGEVVERPLSVVKELTENAIDAGASVITVEIQNGGLSLIRVTDNGGGIAADQVLLAFTQHATSKISDIDDLNRIGTLGFRGEALASIASVSIAEILTKTRGALTGIRAELHGGTVVAKQELGCAEGTTINISNLFFNTPARLKFLKKPSTEAGYITDLMQRLALGYPHLSFRYIAGGQVMLTTSGNGDTRAVIYHIYGRDAAHGLIPIENDDFISGYICKPEIARGSRSGENFFINGRYIKCELLQNAIEEVYKDRLPIGRFPLCVLHLKLMQGQVDVNEHPAKMEVRFADEREIYGRVCEALVKALSSEDLVPVVRPSIRKKAQKREHGGLADLRQPVSDANPQTEDSNIKSQMQFTDYIHTDPIPPSSGTGLSMAEGFAGKGKSHNFSIISQIFGTYWLALQKDELFLIDQHAAHERILYEEKLRQLKNREPVIQILLEPQKLDLSPKELEIAAEHKAALNNFGFQFDNGLLTSVPAGVEPAFFTELLDKLESGGDSPLSKIREEIALSSCKAAVKAKDFLTANEARNLINRMLALENPYTCPHGRPTMIKLTLKEIEHMFKRT